MTRLRVQNSRELRPCRLGLRLAWRGWLVLVALLVGTTSPALAFPSKFTFEPSYTMPTLVDDRPVISDWLASVHDGSVLEGRLELNIYADSVFLGRVLTDELVFTGLDQRVRILLPPYRWDPNTTEILVNIELHSNQGTFKLPTQRLRTTLPFTRKFPLLMGETKQRPRSTRGRDRLADRLKFESLLPEDFQERAITLISQQKAEDFPQDPLAYCHYEVVVIADDVFTALRGPQLEALVKWVKAGGSLYLEPRGILGRDQLDFLNQLAADDARKLVFAADDRGRLPDGLFAERDGFLALDCGLGRVVLTSGEAPELTARSHRMIAATLWKFRHKWVTLLESRPLHANDLYNAMGNQPQNNLSWLTLSPPPMDDIPAGLINWLRPPGVNLVPLWLIALLLVILILLIGPVDFFVLGMLRRRKWTWITFPACTLLMTGLTIWLTQTYLSTSEARRSLIIHDVGPAGDIVRTNEFELVFTSATRQLNSNLQASLFTPLLTGGQTNYELIGYQPRPNLPRPGPVYLSPSDLSVSPRASDPVVISGRMPNRFDVKQQVRQWTPQLNRRFSIGSPVDVPKLDWDALQLPMSFSQPDASDLDLLSLQLQVRQQLGPEAQVAVLPVMGGARTTEPAENRPRVLGHMEDPMFWAMQQRGYSQCGLRNAMPPQTNSLERLSTQCPYGLAMLVTHTSPHGGVSLDDLPFATPGEWFPPWLIIMAPVGDDLVVYRKCLAHPR